MYKKTIIIITIIIVSLSLLFAFYWFFVATKCEQDFNIYPEKGYCEFDLKTCEGFFGCKEYEKVQIICSSEATLCGEKVLCDCNNTE